MKKARYVARTHVPIAALLGLTCIGARAAASNSIHTLAPLPAGYNNGALLADNNGNLYGTGWDGSVYGGPGSVFRLSPPADGQVNWTVTTLYNSQYGFVGKLAQDTSGNLFGVEGTGTIYSPPGRVFELIKPTSPSTKWRYKLIYLFGNLAAGAVPGAGVVIGPGGVIYGTTSFGGYVDPKDPVGAGLGTVFSLSPPALPNGRWKETVLYRFHGTGDSVSPHGGVILDAAGNLYGTAYGLLRDAYPAAYDYGAVFELLPPKGNGRTWTYSIVHRFQGGSDGIYPSGSLTFGKNGDLFGTTQFGGSGSFGTVYEIKPNASGTGQGRAQVIVSFAGFENAPLDGVTFDRSGNLYGTTLGLFERPQLACGGSIFKMTPPPQPGDAWTESALVVLGKPGTGKFGCFPNAGITLAPSGALFGVTSSPGAVFTIKP